MLKFSFYLFIILILNGCIPKIVTISPTIDGIVIDKATNKRVKNVMIGSSKTGVNNF